MIKQFMSEDLHGPIDELIAERDTVIEYTKHLIAERDEARRIARKYFGLWRKADMTNDRLLLTIDRNWDIELTPPHES